jgi:hypothetical protein
MMDKMPYGQTADQARVDRIESLRVKALESQDALQYRFYSDMLGISEHSIEDRNLYEVGELEVQKADRATLTKLDRLAEGKEK